MAIFTLNSRAEDDMVEIISFTRREWSDDQAEKYAQQLESAFQLLADRPQLGRKCGSVRAALRRFEVQSHVIFYEPVDGGILVRRVLHKNMQLPPHNAM